MTELIVPIARRLILNQAAIPMSLAGKIDGVIRNEADAREIGHAFGRSHQPRKPILLLGPDERTVILIVGGEAAEIEDIALAKLDQQKRQAAKGERGWRFDEARESWGAPPREKVDGMIRQSMADYVKRKKQNSRTGGS